MKLEVHDLTKRYGATRALDGLTLPVETARVLVLIGRHPRGFHRQRQPVERAGAGAYRAVGRREKHVATGARRLGKR
jgi:ABC-type polar amino acid transport system ATPase subunit